VAEERRINATIRGVSRGRGWSTPLFFENPYGHDSKKISEKI